MKNRENEIIQKVIYEERKHKQTSPKHSPKRSPKNPNKSPSKSPSQRSGIVTKSKFNPVNPNVAPNSNVNSNVNINANVNTNSVVPVPTMETSNSRKNMPKAEENKLNEVVEENKNHEELDFKLEENEMHPENINIEGNPEGIELAEESQHSSDYLEELSNPDGENYNNTLIAELKNQISFLETTVNEKEDKFLALKDEFEKSNFENIKVVEGLQKNLDSWQKEYNKQLVRNKTLYDEFEEWMSKKEKGIRDSFINVNNDLEKKILHLEKVNAQLMTEMDKINQMNAAYNKECDMKIKRFGEQNSKLLFKYEELWKTYEVDLNSLTDMVLILPFLTFLNITYFFRSIK